MWHRRNRPRIAAIARPRGLPGHRGWAAVALRARQTSLAVLLLLGPALSAGCSRPESSEPPRIDMSSDEAAARSIGRVRDSLDEEQRRELTDATMVLVRQAMGADRAAALDPDKARVAVKQVLDGKTAAEVIAAAQAVEASGARLPGSGNPAPTAAAPGH